MMQLENKSKTLAVLFVNQTKELHDQTPLQWPCTTKDLHNQMLLYLATMVLNKPTAP